jgi:hypothetical protein
VQLVGRDTDAVVLDRDDDPAVVLLRGEPDVAAVLSVLGRVS